MKVFNFFVEENWWGVNLTVWAENNIQMQSRLLLTKRCPGMGRCNYCLFKLDKCVSATYCQAAKLNFNFNLNFNAATSGFGTLCQRLCCLCSHCKSVNCRKYFLSIILRLNWYIQWTWIKMKCGGKQHVRGLEHQRWVYNQMSMHVKYKC